MTRPDDHDAPAGDRPMSLSEHLDELRWRLLRCVVYVVVLAIVCYAYVDPLTDVVLAPVSDQPNLSRLIATKPTEGFFTSMKIVLFCGFFFAAPLVLFELWRFIASGLYDHEKRGIRMYAPFSYFLFLGGIAFSQFILVPVMLGFLFGWTVEIGGAGGTTVENLPQFSEVVNLVIMMAVAMGILFQLPIVMMAAQKIGIVSWRIYAGYRRHFIMGSAIVAAILTPTGDPASLLITMAPVLVLFELGILLCRGADRKKAKLAEKDS